MHYPATGTETRWQDIETAGVRSVLLANHSTYSKHTAVVYGTFTEIVENV